MIAAARLVPFILSLAALCAPQPARAVIEARSTANQVAQQYCSACANLGGVASVLHDNTTQRTVRIIRWLDDHGASDEMIVRAGNAGRSQLHHITESCLGRLDHLTEGTRRVLIVLGAGSEEWGVLQLCFDSTISSIERSEAFTSAAIDAAVAAATAASVRSE